MAASSVVSPEQQGDILSQKAEEELETNPIDRNYALGELWHRYMQKSSVIFALAFVVMMFVYFNTILRVLRVSDAHLIESALKDYLNRPRTTSTGEVAPVFNEIENMVDVWDWMQTGLVGAILPAQEWYNGQPYTPEERDFLINYNKLLGGFRITQHRIQVNVECPRSVRFNAFQPVCWPDLHSNTQDSSSYGPAHDPLRYTATATKDYTIEFPLDRKLAFKKLAELKEALWLDKQTRKIAVDFAVYNSNALMFSVVGMELSFTTTGTIQKDFAMQTFSLEPWPQGTAAGEVLVLLYTVASLLYFAFDFLRNLWAASLLPPRELRVPYVLPALARSLMLKQAAAAAAAASNGSSSDNDNNVGEDKRKSLPPSPPPPPQLSGRTRLTSALLYCRCYLGQFWHLCDIARLALMLHAMLLYLDLFAHPENTGLLLPPPLAATSGGDGGSGVGYVSLTEYAAAFDAMKAVAGGSVFLCLLGLMKYFALSYTYGVIVHTLLFSGANMLSFLLVTGLSLAVFSEMGVVMFGARILDYSSFFDGLLANLKLFVGDGGALAFADFSDVSLSSAVLFYGPFLVVAVFLLLNVFLAIVMGAYEGVLERGQQVEAQQRVRHHGAHMCSVPQELLFDWHLARAKPHQIKVEQALAMLYHPAVMPSDSDKQSPPKEEEEEGSGWEDPNLVLQQLLASDEPDVQALTFSALKPLFGAVRARALIVAFSGDGADPNAPPVTLTPPPPAETRDSGEGEPAAAVTAFTSPSAAGGVEHKTSSAEGQPFSPVRQDCIQPSVAATPVYSSASGSSGGGQQPQQQLLATLLSEVGALRAQVAALAAASSGGGNDSKTMTAGIGLLQPPPQPAATATGSIAARATRGTLRLDPILAD